MRCTRHPEVEAFHCCTLCGNWHCEPCLKPLETPGSSRPLLTCPDCGGLARVAMERVPTPREDLMDLVRRPASGEGLLTAFVIALPFGATVLPVRGLPFFLAVVHLACIVSYYFQTVDHVGRGLPGLPFSAAPVSRGDVVMALLRGFACLLVAVGPAYTWSMFIPDAPVIAFALLLFGAALAPAAIVTTAVSGQLWTALWPFSWARIIARAPAAYGRAVGLFIGSSVAWGLVDLLAVYTLGRIPVLGPLLLATVNGVLAIFQAVLIGGFLRRNASDLGYD